MVVTDAGIISAGIWDEVSKFIPQKVKTKIFDRVTANPTLSQVIQRAKLAKTIPDLDLILAVGGGSPIDAAKAISVLV